MVYRPIKKNDPCWQYRQACQINVIATFRAQAISYMWCYTLELNGNTKRLLSASLDNDTVNATTVWVSYAVMPGCRVTLPFEVNQDGF